MGSPLSYQTLNFDLMSSRNIYLYNAYIYTYILLGNYISLELEIDNKFTILLINIYGPNLDSPQFYSNINDIICASTSDFYTLCGDFNLVQEFELDCLNYKNLNNPRARNKLLELKNTHNLKDPWRIYNPKVRKFTWFNIESYKQIKIRFLSYIRRITFIDELCTDKTRI